MTFTKKLAIGAAAIAMATAWGGIASAQQTTSAIRGVITTDTGAPLANSTVRVIDATTGRARTVTTDANGQFVVRNLSVGGEYTVSASSEGYQSESVEGIALTLGDVSSVNIDLAQGTVSDEIVVQATKSLVSEVAVGPSASFDLETLQKVPSINRNITDVLRLDPRISVDESRGGINAVNCAGQNSRFNSLTVDGVRMNDSFGLNSNGYPTERIPFSFDAIEQVSVELAPFDVQYGGFTACNINAVTKAGGNEFHGGVFFDYTDDGLRSDSLEGDNISTGEFDETRWGFNVTGPIVQDKLFFSVAYEKLEGANLFDRGPIGSGAVNEVNVTQAELDEIVQIANDIYQYDPGTIPQSLGNEDEKLFVKLDWNISDLHRASFSYNYNDGFNTVQSDGDNNEIEFSNHLYERGSELVSYQGTLYSDWTDNFSTEFRVGYLELDNRQESVGGTDFGEIRVELDNVDVYLGGDDSRQSNKLDYDLFNFALKGNYNAGNHQFSFGIEREELEVFNLFVQHTETEIRFDGIDNFRDGFADAIYYNNAPSNNPNDAAAEWGYALNTVYGQDEYDFGNGFSVIAGLRYDWYTSDDKPEENADFVADYGFSNSTNLDGEGLLQPRLAFQWDASDVLKVHGGIGLYSGGNPNVWLSNNFSANNVLQFGQRGRSFNYTDGTRSLFDADVVYAGLEDGVPNGPGYGVPQELFDAVAGGVGDNFEMNYLDPNFEIPSEWKYSVGATYFADFGDGPLGGEYVLTGDLLWSDGQDTAIVLRADIEATGVRADGSTIYSSVREPAFVLTNSSEGNQSFVASFGVAKEYDNGIDWTFGYAYSDAEDVNPMTSSVAFSNYVNRAFNDPQEQVLSTSNYNTEHRFTTTFNYEREFWADNATRFSAFGLLESGQPYSLTQLGNGVFDNFTPFLDDGDNVLVDGASRNGEEGSWWGKVDIKLEQEFPGIRANDKASAFIVIDNFTNLLSDEWGILRQVNFPGNVNAADLAAGDVDAESRIGDASRYEIRFGVKYDF